MSEPKKKFQFAVDAMRRSDFQEAIEMLKEVVAEDSDLIYAPLCLKYAIAMSSGSKDAEVMFEQRKFKFLLSNLNIGHEIKYASGIFNEEAELRYCLKTIPKRSVIVDVGANIGNHTVFFAGMLSPKLLVPVEPTPLSIDLLRRNLALNQFQVDERGIGLAAGRSNEKIYVNLPEKVDLVQARTSRQPETPGSILVPTIRLDDLISERVDFLKIDVEGFEDDVLDGAVRILTEDKPLLMIELADNRFDNFVARVSFLGYKPIIGFGGVGYKNVFFRVQ